MAECEDLDQDDLIRRGLLIEVMEDAATLRLYDLMAKHNNSSLADVSCFLLAQETQRPLLTGDGRLRRQAAAEGLEVHGALWLLDQMVIHAVLRPDAAAAALERMLARNARLPAVECQARLKRWRAGIDTFDESMHGAGRLRDALNR